LKKGPNFSFLDIAFFVFLVRTIFLTKWYLPTFATFSAFFVISPWSYIFNFKLNLELIWNNAYVI
jgi:pilus assembly protein TadC